MMLLMYIDPVGIIYNAIMDVSRCGVKDMVRLTDGLGRLRIGEEVKICERQSTKAITN